MCDSKLSLDVGFGSRDSVAMIAQPYHLYVERVAPEKNMARFYALTVQPTLFGGVAVVRAWGRIGTRGQEMVQLFDNEGEAVSLFLDVLREKRRRGYQPKGVVDIHRIQAMPRSPAMTTRQEADTDFGLFYYSRKSHDHHERNR